MMRTLLLLKYKMHLCNELLFGFSLMHAVYFQCFTSFYCLPDEGLICHAFKILHANLQLDDTSQSTNSINRCK